MESNQSKVTFPHTSPAEWRWVITLSVVLIVLISLPFAMALWIDANEPERTFTGFVINPLDGSTYLSKIQLGREGYWRTFFRHSPDPGNGAYLTLVYNGLGHVSRILGLSNVLTFHAARLITTFIMFLALYHLAATIWRRTHTRRLFFVLVAIGSGFGWLMLPITQISPDIAIAEAFPLYSAIVNVHFPLALALVAIIASVIVSAFRPGVSENPQINNGGLTLFLSCLLLSAISPHALVPITLGVGLMSLFEWIRARRINFRHIRWLLMMVLPAVPFAAYYYFETRYNPVVAAWSAQNVTLTPPLPIFLLGFGIPLLLALPGLYRAVRRFEADGDRFMLLWLLSIVVCAYLPFLFQRRFMMGLMIPIVYFAVRSLVDFWLPGRSRHGRNRILWGAYSLSTVSYLLLFFFWFWAATMTSTEEVYLSTDYVQAISWVDENTTEGRVVLASTHVSRWIPAQASLSVVYGHPFETTSAAVNQELVADWYGATSPDAPICAELIERFDVAYIFVGPDEAAYGQAACAENLEQTEQIGDVLIYAP